MTTIKHFGLQEDGLYKYDLTAGKLTAYIMIHQTRERFVGGNPRDLYRDPTGLMWIATISGITILDPRSSQIKSHPDIS